jgi:rhamnosyltransferase
MVAAIIVLYRPDLSLLRRLLESVADQVQGIIAVDNTPGSSTELLSLFERFTYPVSYVPLGDNMGIATAQNIGIRKCLSEGYSHVLLLDQDSCPNPDMVSKLVSAEQKLLESGKKVASIGPLFIDEKNGTASTAIRHGWMHVNKIPLLATMKDPVEADYLIASGSLTRTSVLAEVGPMLDELFIDRVDIEWGLRARSTGSLCYIAPNAIMTHSIGDKFVRSVGKDISLHNDSRHYYIVRNSTYLLRLKSMGWRWRTVTVPKIPLYVCFYSWYSGNRWNSLRLLCKAVLDGLHGRVGRLA